MSSDTRDEIKAGDSIRVERRGESVRVWVNGIERAIEDLPSGLLDAVSAATGFATDSPVDVWSGDQPNCREFVVIDPGKVVSEQKDPA